MKVLGIMGSPRIKGNTDLLLDEALKGSQSQGADIEKLVISKLKIAPCKADYGCNKNGECVIKDDMQGIYAKLLEADCVIIASPIFFYGLTAQVKALIDRSQALWVRRYVLKWEMSVSGRKGAFIAVGATKGKNLFDGSMLTVKYFFDAIGVKYTDDLLIHSIDQKGEILEHPTAMTGAYNLGKRLAMR